MSDQADSLRQLVRAQRQWREYILREQPVVVTSPENLHKRKEIRHESHDFRVSLTVSLKRIARVVRYSIGVKFLERREGKGQAHRRPGSRHSR